MEDLKQQWSVLSSDTELSLNWLVVSFSSPRAVLCQRNCFTSWRSPKLTHLPHSWLLSWSRMPVSELDCPSSFPSPRHHWQPTWTNSTTTRYLGTSVLGRTAYFMLFTLWICSLFLQHIHIPFSVDKNFEATHNRHIQVPFLPVMVCFFKVWQHANSSGDSFYCFEGCSTVCIHWRSVCVFPWSMSVYLIEWTDFLSTFRRGGGWKLQETIWNCWRPSPHTSDLLYYNTHPTGAMSVWLARPKPLQWGWHTVSHMWSYGVRDTVSNPHSEGLGRRSWTT